MVLLGVGGNTTTIAQGGSKLHTAATATGHLAKGADHAGGLGAGAGDADLVAALGRYATAASATARALKTQIEAAANLATNAAADLDATDGH